MAHRTFRDESGREWDVWEVVPTAVERRISRHAPVTITSSPERRRAADVRVVVPAELQKGWLAFQSGTERKRLAPIPKGWSDLSEDALRALLQHAERRSRAR